MRRQPSILDRDTLVQEAQVRIKVVIRRILRRVSDALIKLLQLSVPNELQEKSFDKLIGVIDLKRFKLDLFAITRGFRKGFFGFIRPIRADVNSHVGLKHRSVMTLREIVDDASEKTVRRLGWNKPISNHNSFHARRMHSISAHVFNI